jgi:hypothetical protein
MPSSKPLRTSTPGSKSSVIGNDGPLTFSKRAGHVTADRMQWLLNGSARDTDRLRDARHHAPG